MIRRAILIDTGPLYAAVDPDDQYHAHAQSEMLRLANERLEGVITYSTLSEAYTLILRPLGIKTAHRWFEEIGQGAVLINPMPEDYVAAGELVQTYADQPITLFDAVLVVVSRRLDLPIWTYDYHFDVMRANVWR